MVKYHGSDIRAGLAHRSAAFVKQTEPRVHCTEGKDGCKYYFKTNEEGKTVRISSEEYERIRSVGAHMLDCGMVATILNQRPGPKLSKDNLDLIKEFVNSDQNFRKKTNEGNNFADKPAEQDFNKLILGQIGTFRCTRSHTRKLEQYKKVSQRIENAEDEAAQQLASKLPWFGERLKEVVAKLEHASTGVPSKTGEAQVTSFQEVASSARSLCIPTPSKPQTPSNFRPAPRPQTATHSRIVSQPQTPPSDLHHKKDRALDMRFSSSKDAVAKGQAPTDREQNQKQQEEHLARQEARKAEQEKQYQEHLARQAARTVEKEKKQEQYVARQAAREQRKAEHEAYVARQAAREQRKAEKEKKHEQYVARQAAQEQRKAEKARKHEEYVERKAARASFRPSFSSSRVPSSASWSSAPTSSSSHHYRTDCNLDMRYSSSRTASGLNAGGLHFRTDGGLDMRYNSSKDMVASFGGLFYC